MDFNAKAKALENMKKMARDMKSEGFKKGLGVEVKGSNPEAVKAGLDEAKKVVGQIPGSDSDVVPEFTEKHEPDQTDSKDQYSGEHDEAEVEAMPENPKLTELVKSLSKSDKMQLYKMLHEEHEASESPELEASEHAGEVEE